jgi:hypothetical protein
MTDELLNQALDADEDEVLRNRLAYLLAGVAVALKGPEKALTRWGYGDLPEIAAKAMIELEIYRQQSQADRLDAQEIRDNALEDAAVECLRLGGWKRTFEHVNVVSAADAIRKMKVGQP